MHEGDTTPNPDDLLPPIEKLEKYVYSENVFNRQIVARNVLETIRNVVDDAEEVEAVLNVMNKLADDREPSVRSELMEQVPHIAMYCQEMKSSLNHVVPAHLLPMVVKFLTDTNNQVRKTSQAALLVLLEQGLVERSDVQQQVCPVIIELIEADEQDDYRTEAVALLSKMAPLIGKEMVEKLFLERFALLCLDPLFHVRKVCAANFGDFSSVVGSESTESVLLRKFFYLCEDDVWGVRKACAEVFMPLSCVCTPSVRLYELSPLFVNLLRDQSRWVRMAAFQALGPFISTFADSSITALLHNDNGEIVITDHDSLAERLEELEFERAAQRADKERLRQKEAAEAVTTKPASSLAAATASVIDPTRDDGNDDDNGEVQMDVSAIESTNSQLVVAAAAASEDDLSAEERRAKSYEDKRLTSTASSSTSSSSSSTTSTTSDSTSTTVAAVEDFNNFLFWRDPPLPLDDTTEEKSEHTQEEDSENNKDSADDTSTMEMFRPATSSSGSGTNASHAIIPPTNGPSSANNSSSSQSTFDPRFDAHPTDPALPRGPPATDQDIVPQLLIDHFVSMIDPSRAQTVDSDIARHCAFSLPAVALTLGRSNWPLLKDTYEALATDMQWKVRRTLASSIHELGAILGPEASANDLIPVFNGFLKDLDEVRIGLLKHLGDFLVLLDMDRRREYLPKLPDFLKMDNDRNWRFRLELTEQLEKLLPLYSPADVDEHVSPMVMVLIRDKVASVRRLATNVLSSILLALNNSENPDLAQNLVKIIVEAQAMDSHWVHRQTYASLTYQVHATNALEPPQLAESLMPSLLELSEDRVANVRLAVARTLSRIDIETDFYKNNQVDDCRLRIETVEMNLKNDSDVDVRAFYGGSQKRYGNSGSLEEGTAAESTTNVSADDEDAEDHCVPAENSKTEEDSGSSRREVEVEEEEDDQDDDEDDVGASPL